MTEVSTVQVNAGGNGKMLDALLVLYIANELLGLVARAIENGQTQVTREQVDAAFSRADVADAKWEQVRTG
ncbi:MAG: hypothetical protein GXY74_10820 [Phycisphaerae bacterium]|nr:hypothetical protein [Phycisphaerae bacterium]